MVESCVLSFATLLLMIWEAVKREELILREGKQLSLDKIELLDEAGGGRGQGYGGGLAQVMPGQEGRGTSPSNAGLTRQDRGAISLNKIKFQLQNNVTMSELKDAETRQAPTPRTLKRRIE